MCNRNLIPEISESSGLTCPAKSPQIGVTNSLKLLQAPEVDVTSARYRVSPIIHFILAGKIQQSLVPYLGVKIDNLWMLEVEGVWQTGQTMLQENTEQPATLLWARLCTLMLNSEGVADMARQEARRNAGVPAPCSQTQHFTRCSEIINK